jgi:antitoxin component YwqK of YwqJK toxin-antitoxin module
MRTGFHRYGVIFFSTLLACNVVIGQEGGNEGNFEQNFYPNGQLSSEGIMRDGKPDGYWKSYYVTGVIKSEGKRINFLLDSTWNFYDQTGEINQKIDYKLGEKSGYSVRFSYDNPLRPGRPTVISKELYVNGKKKVHPITIIRQES